MWLETGSIALGAAGAGAAAAVMATTWWQRRKQAATNVQPDLVAMRDALTGLASRAGLETQLETACAAADASDSTLCVLYITLDNLDWVNDAHGHTAGDAVLAQTGERLRSVVPEGAPLARIGGSEFVIVAQGPLAAGDALAQRVADVVSTPFAVEGAEPRLTCSIGIAVYPEDGSQKRIVSMSASAMRSVKLAGGAAHTRFLPRMAVDQREQAAVAQDLRQAIERKELELFYQPKIDARSQQITAAEALLRWRHPSRGMVSPVLFIPVAERHGLIGEIGDWVLDEALRQAALWRDQGLRMRVAINVSGYQMRQDDFAKRLERGLKAHRLQASRFTCEITETVAMEDTGATQRAFARLGRIGVHVSIDDFGTGYSSLATLRRLPAAELKIDRAFVSDIDHSADACTIAQAIVQMAHTLGLRVVAEGVETDAQRDHLMAMGCDELQGFLFAKPMSAQALGLWAMDDRAAVAAGFRPSLFRETVSASLL
jgi:diguanylate cyclase (GGDEF)-like protein